MFWFCFPNDFDILRTRFSGWPSDYFQLDFIHCLKSYFLINPPLLIFSHRSESFGGLLWAGLEASLNFLKFDTISRYW
jgi:hypothetical protein